MYRREERLRYCSYVLVSRDLHHCMALNTLRASFKPVSDTLRHFYLCVFDQQMECSLDILRNKTYDERVDSIYDCVNLPGFGGSAGASSKGAGCGGSSITTKLDGNTPTRPWRRPCHQPSST